MSFRLFSDERLEQLVLVPAADADVLPHPTMQQPKVSLRESQPADWAIQRFLQPPRSKNYKLDLSTGHLRALRSVISYRASGPAAAAEKCVI